MVLGIITNAYWMYLYKTGHYCPCDAPEIMMWSCIVLYGSYLFLFLKFFFERYLFTKSEPKKKGETKKTTKPVKVD